MENPNPKWKVADIKRWLSKRGVEYGRSDGKAKLLQLAASAPAFVDRTLALASRDWLVGKGYSTQYEKQDGDLSGPMYTTSNPYGFSTWVKRKQLLEGLEIIKPFLVPPKSGDVMGFDEFLKAKGWHPGTDDPGLKKNKEGYLEEKGGYLIEEVAAALSKNRKPFPKMMPEAIRWALAQHGKSACTLDTVLVVPYLGDTAVQLHPNREATDAAANDLLQGRILPDKNESEFLLDKPHYGANAEAVADELSACTLEYAIVLIQQIDYSGNAESDAKHMNSVVIHMRTRRAFYFEPHLSDESYSAPTNTTNIAYNEIQSSVEQFLEEAIGASMQHAPSKESCPVESSASFSGLQSTDQLCASWSVYAAALYALNPTIPTETLVQTISFSDVYRMLYVIFTAVPMTRSLGRHSQGTDFMYKYHKRYGPLVEQGFVNRDAQTQLVKHMQKNPTYFDSFKA
jgi:hypothetical protein